MRQFRDFAGEPQLPYHAWRALLYANYGRYNPEGIEPAAFVGWVRPLSTNGLTAVDIGCNAPRIERTQRDIRLDGVEHYSVLFQVAGCSAFSQNDRVTRVATNDVVLIDTARPMTCFVDNCVAQWLILDLPRRSLISHLGFEPQGGASRCGGTRAGRALLDLVQGADEGDESLLSAGHSYIQLAFYDLVGALFVPSEQGSVSRHSDKLFAHVHRLMVEHFADPDFGPSDVAAKAGISLRYVQKLFAGRARAAANTFIPCVWTTRRVPYVAARYWANTNHLARSHMNAAFATTLISREDFVAGLVVLRARTLENVINATDTEHDGHRNTMRGAPAVPSTSGNSQLLRRFVA
jgi:AraC family transcriptional regulator, positive regulator of tynA and feaB